MTNTVTTFRYDYESEDYERQRESSSEGGDGGGGSGGFCRPYGGVACSPYIGNKVVYLSQTFRPGHVEESLRGIYSRTLSPTVLGRIRTSCSIVRCSPRGKKDLRFDVSGNERSVRVHSHRIRHGTERCGAVQRQIRCELNFTSQVCY